MGIKDFSKVFKALRTIKWGDYDGQSIAIDSMTEIYRAALGAKTVNALTDSKGRPTMHINVYLANIIEWQKQNITQIHVFDHESDEKSKEFHNPAKVGELLKRQQKKEVAQKKKDDLFSDSEDDEETTQTKQDQKSSLEKQLFRADKTMINDIKFMLNCFNIQYVEAPEGFEGECIASYLNSTGRVDAVYSGDTDPIAFGAPVLLRRNPRDKKIYEYHQSDILKQLKKANPVFKEPDLDDVRKVCLILGTDFAKKTPKIGPATVLKKLDTLRLTKEQKDAWSHFEETPNSDDIEIHNEEKTPFVNCQPEILLEWLVKEKSFSRSKVINWIRKVIPSFKPEGYVEEVKQEKSKRQKSKSSKTTRLKESKN